MVGHRPSHNLMQAGHPDILSDGLVALRSVFGIHGLGYLTTTTTMRWHMPFALRGGGLD
jgi:hypothetical protein